jgi:formylmethanofuran dehydrogenase subunit C
MIVLTVRKKLQFPVMAECISPSVFQGKTVKEIAALPVWEGNKQKKLSDIFIVEQTPRESPSITINGDAAEVRRVGSGMTMGEIVINGNIGMHLGEKMCDGRIVVNGDAGQWAGSDMSGGKIIVDGNVGSDSGVALKGGVIKIRGDAGPFLGFQMRDGTIHVEKKAATRVGASMTGGKIIISGSLEEPVPTFTIDNIKPKVKLDAEETIAGPFYVFLGDLAENSTSGKLFVSKTNNPHLNLYERYL